MQIIEHRIIPHVFVIFHILWIPSIHCFISLLSIPPIHTVCWDNDVTRSMRVWKSFHQVKRKTTFSKLMWNSFREGCLKRILLCHLLRHKGFDWFNWQFSSTHFSLRKKGDMIVYLTPFKFRLPSIFAPFNFLPSNFRPP